ncbi:MAG: hypothetical protein ABI836_14300 [Gemmatimonadota bacterium]
MSYDERCQSGLVLARRLAKRHLSDPIIFVMSTGGVRLAREIARRLHAPMDVLIALEVIEPGWRQLQLGAVAGGMFFPDQGVISSEGLPADYVDRLAAYEIKQAESAESFLRRQHPPLDVAGRGCGPGGRWVGQSPGR